MNFIGTGCYEKVKWKFSHSWNFVLLRPPKLSLLFTSLHRLTASNYLAYICFSAFNSCQTPISRTYPQAMVALLDLLKIAADCSWSRVSSLIANHKQDHLSLIVFMLLWSSYGMHWTFWIVIPAVCKRLQKYVKPREFASMSTVKYNQV